MNDWEISKFLELIMVLQVSILVLLVLDTLGIHIPILRDFVAFFYLLFVPGMLLLRIMRLHKLGNIETLLYTVGLSIATLMFVGAFMNLVYPLFGISKPISLVPLMATLTLIVCFFVVLSYKMDKNFADADTIEIKTFSLIFLCFLPFLAVFGTYLMNFYNLNVVLIFLILIICLLIISVAFNKIPKEYYAFTVFVVSISLLFHVSLISNYLTGWDIQQEYYLASLVVKNSYWNHTIYTQCNAMLSVTILPSLFSIISGVNLVWIFKIIYPLLFSLVPLGLYEIFKKQTNPEIAFFSCLLFVSFFAFYNDMLGLARQQIAELFLVLSVMLMLSKMERSKKQILFIFFGLSIILSHYSIAVLYIFALVVVLILSYLSRRVIISKIAAKLPGSMSNVMERLVEFMDVKSDVIKLKFVLLFLFVAGGSYYLLAGSSTVILIFTTFKHVLIGILGKSVGTSSSEGLNLLLMETSPLHRIGKYVYIASQIFIVFGFLKIFSSKNFKKFRFNKAYMNFAFLSFLMLVACIFMPFFASALNTTRLYHIALIFLAPISVIGGIEFFRFIISKLKLAEVNKKSAELLSIFLVVFLLFNSGLVYALANDNSQSIALNSSYDTANYNQMEKTSASWLNYYGLGFTFASTKKGGVVLSDDYRRPILRSFGMEPVVFSKVMNNTSDLETNLKEICFPKYKFCYMYFGTKNLLDNNFEMLSTKGVNVGNPLYENKNDIINDKDEIYDNKGSQIYYFNI
jgi:uncharacterized membrane protein